MRKAFVLKERLYKTEDGRVVREGHQDAASVYRGVGQRIPLEEAVALGLTDGKAGDGDGSIEVEVAAAVRDATDEELVSLMVDAVLEIKERDIDVDDERAWTDLLGEEKLEALSEVFGDSDSPPATTEVQTANLVKDATDEDLQELHSNVLAELGERDMAPVVEVEVTAPEPFEDYSKAKADEVVEKVADLSLAELLALHQAEEAGKGRSTILKATAARLELAEKALTEGSGE